VSKPSSPLRKPPQRSRRPPRARSLLARLRGRLESGRGVDAAIAVLVADSAHPQALGDLAWLEPLPESEGLPLWVGDACAATAWPHPPPSALMARVERAQVGSLLLVPIQVGAQATGSLLALGWTRASRRHHSAAAQTRARRAARALAPHMACDSLATELGARTTELARAHGRAKALAEASRVITLASLDLPRVLSAVCEQASVGTGDVCTVRLVSSDGQWLEPVAIYHPEPEALSLLRGLLPLVPFPTDSGPNAEVLRTGQPLSFRAPLFTAEFTRAAPPETRPLLTRFDGASVTLVPLRVRNRVIGTLGLTREPARGLHPGADQAFLIEFADRAAAAIENARLYEEARRAVELRNDFLSVASHELRTPLTSLELSLGSVARLVHGEGDKGERTSRVVKRLEGALRQTERMARLLDQLLDVSTIAGGGLHLLRSPCDLAALCREVLDGLADTAAAKGCALRLDAQPLVGQWDRPRIEQLLVLLVENAMKYGRGLPVEVVLEPHDGGARLLVRDHGIGIPEPDRLRVFGRFERAVSSRNYGGLGLGLYIVQQIVQAHGGTISVGDTHGGGATLTVDLPAMEAR
jgi:signal transduction histidine kinase